MLRQYEKLPIAFGLEQFCKIYNILFTQERPGIADKYAISELLVVEMRVPNERETEHEAEIA